MRDFHDVDSYPERIRPLERAGYFNPIKEAKWGETTIMPHVVVNNLWVFAGSKL